MTTAAEKARALTEPKLAKLAPSGLPATLTVIDAAPVVSAQLVAPARRSRLISSLAAEIFAFSKLPRLSWGFAELDKYAPFIAGGLVMLLGATGRGKTSFLFQAGRHHARTLGPVLVVSAELIGAIAGARMASAVLGKAWGAVLGGDVDRADVERALDAPNMRIVDEIGPDILRVIEAELVAFAADFPGTTPLVLVDYVQLLPGENPEMRHKVTENVIALRKLAAKFGAGIMVIAKAGRGPSRGLRSGEVMGSDATEAGSETNAIEYEAIALVALGAMRPLSASDPDGPAVIDVSIAKARFGVADKIVPLLFEGASGRFSDHGSAVSAADRRAAIKALGDSAKIDTLVRSVRDLVANSDRPLSKAEITDKTTGNNVDIAAAIKRLTCGDAPELVHVVGDGAKRRGGASPIWTADRANAAGMTIVPSVVVARG